MRAAGLVCLGAGAGLIRADLRAVRGTDVRLPVRRGDRGGPRRPARGRCRYWPATSPAARPRRQSAGTGLVTGGTERRPPEHHHPADPLAGRRGRAAPAGRLPAARHLAGGLRPSCSAWPRSCTPPGSPAPSGSATCSPAWNPPARPGRGPAARGGPAAMIPLPVLEEITDRSGIAPRIELLLPTGVRARQLLVRTLLLGMLIVLADHRPAHLTRVHQALVTPARGRPAAARRGRGLEARPAPAHLPPDRADLRPRRGRAGQGHPRRAALRPAAAHLRRPARGIDPGGVQGRQHVARRWTGPTWKPSPGPRPAAPATAPTPKPPGGTAPAAAPARTASCSSATTPRPPP